MSASAIAYLESDDYFRKQFNGRYSRQHIRPLFSLHTEHEFSVGADADGASEMEILEDAWGTTPALHEFCGLCGKNPIILGADNVDSA